MSELSPALISIAGGNEFLFARFYHIYEGVQLVLPESPPIVSGVSDMPRRIVQTWKRHGIRCKHSTGRNAHIFLQRIFHLHFHMKSSSVFLVILLIAQRALCLLRQFLIRTLFCYSASSFSIYMQFGLSTFTGEPVSSE